MSYKFSVTSRLTQNFQIKTHINTYINIFPPLSPFSNKNFHNIPNLLPNPIKMQTLSCDAFNEILDYLDNLDCKNALFACPTFQIFPEKLEQRKRLHGNIGDCILKSQKDDLEKLLRRRYPSNPTKRKDLLTYLESILPNVPELPSQSPSIQMLDILSSCLDKKHDNKIYVIYGDGNNGKTTFVNFIRTCFKSITQYVSLSTIAHCENLYFLDLERTLLLFVEDDVDHTLFPAGRLYALSGGDTFFVRAPYEQGKCIVPRLKVFLTCNNIGHLTDRFKSKCVLIHFKRVFIPTPISPLEARQQENMSTILEGLKDEMVSLLLERYVLK